MIFLHWDITTQILGGNAALFITKKGMFRLLTSGDEISELLHQFADLGVVLVLRRG